MFLNNDNFIMNGEILQDAKNGDEDKPWKEKKISSLKVSSSFKRLKLDKRAERTQYCGSFLKFGGCSCCGHKNLWQSNFCRDRLCPMCNWRRSRMLQGQIMQILHSAVQEQKMRFIFLTLTVKNPTKDDLNKTINNMFEGFNRLFKYKKVDNIVVGWVRVLEITRNNKKHSKNYDTYHPHFHVLIGVKPSYFSGQEYLSQKKWVELWQKALKVDYTPVVNVQVVKPKREGQTVEAAVAETATYTVKETDYIHKSDEETDSVIAVLAETLKNRRLIGYGKLFKEIKSKLKLQDVESDTADLIGDDKKECSCPLCGSQLQEILYKWHMGLKNYISVDSENM